MKTNNSFNDEIKSIVRHVINGLEENLEEGTLDAHLDTISEYRKDPIELADYLIDHVYTNRIDTNNENYFCFMQNDISEYSIIGDFINSIYNPYAASLDLSKGTAAIENDLLDFFSGLVGYGDNHGGQFTSGASIGNLSALIVARDDKLEESDLSRGVVYLSDQAHSSLIKAAKFIGLQKTNIRIVPSMSDYTINLDLLTQYICEDLESGLKPFCLVGTLGTTNTGAIDPLNELGEIANTYDLWFHVDAAYGGSVLMSSFKHLAVGIERSDSMTWDAHKWLFQTYGCSIMLCKDRSKLLRSFSTSPEYLKDVESREGKVNFWDLGIEMTRPARGMKLWYTLNVMGLDQVKSRIDRVFDFSKELTSLLIQHKDIQILSKASLGIINFRFYNKYMTETELNKINQYISDRAIKENKTLFMTTVLNGKKTLRFNFKNPRTQLDTFNEILIKMDDWVKDYLEELTTITYDVYSIS